LQLEGQVRWHDGVEAKKLKKLLAGQMLDLAAMKELVSKKRWRLP